MHILLAKYQTSRRMRKIILAWGCEKNKLKGIVWPVEETHVTIVVDIAFFNGGWQYMLDVHRHHVLILSLHFYYVYVSVLLYLFVINWVFIQVLTASYVKVVVLVLTSIVIARYISFFFFYSCARVYPCPVLCKPKLKLCNVPTIERERKQDKKITVGYWIISLE